MSKERKVFYNCKVYTGELPLRGAFAVENGFFTEVWDEIPSGLEPEVETVDLEGRFVCPGFNDSHMHLLNYGKTLAGADLTAHTGSLRDL
ncbi:MAG: amidohydrolase family protein, partial [Oscillospiraceae bacterium]|nr:amidohydrolase family protein [Oscillospiraceae bacterium]